MFPRALPCSLAGVVNEGFAGPDVTEATHRVGESYAPRNGKFARLKNGCSEGLYLSCTLLYLQLLSAYRRFRVRKGRVTILKNMLSFAIRGVQQARKRA